jgi:hypothetical protein
MDLVAGTIGSLSLIAFSFAQGNETKARPRAKPTGTVNGVGTVAPALEKYAQGPLLDLWKRPDLGHPDGQR